MFRKTPTPTNETTGCVTSTRPLQCSGIEGLSSRFDHTLLQAQQRCINRQEQGFEGVLQPVKLVTGNKSQTRRRTAKLCQPAPVPKAKATGCSASGIPSPKPLHTKMTCLAFSLHPGASGLQMLDRTCTQPQHASSFWLCCISIGRIMAANNTRYAVKGKPVL